MIGPALPPGSMPLGPQQAPSIGRPLAPALADGADPYALPPLQMQWAGSQAAGVGFRNCGNTCFLNSVLQCLTHIPPLAQLAQQRFHRVGCSLTKVSEDCVACWLMKRVSRSLGGTAPNPDTPMTFINHMSTHISQRFVKGRQEDAHEFLRMLLEAVERDALRSMRGPKALPDGLDPETLVAHLFGGTLRSQVKCGGCGAESNTLDPFLDLSLELLGCTTVLAALKRFTAAENLAGANAYKCDKCKRKVQAQRSISIWEAPNVLALHLKRFEGLAGKITRPIGFPERLSLLDFVAADSPERARMVSAREEALEKLVEERRRKQREAEAEAARQSREAEKERQRRLLGRGGRGRGGRANGFSMRGGFSHVNGRGHSNGPLSPHSGNGLQPNGSAGNAASPGVVDGATSAAGTPPAGFTAATPEEQQAADEAAAAKAAALEAPEYELTGVLVHQGFSAASGHYYAFVKDGSGQWMRMNDTNVYPIGVSKVLQENAYMLFYVRQSQRSYPTRAAKACAAAHAKAEEKRRAEARAKLWKSGAGGGSTAPSGGTEAAAAAVGDDASEHPDSPRKKKRLGFDLNAFEARRVHGNVPAHHQQQPQPDSQASNGHAEAPQPGSAGPLRLDPMLAPPPDLLMESGQPAEIEWLPQAGKSGQPDAPPEPPPAGDAAEDDDDFFGVSKLFTELEEGGAEGPSGGPGAAPPANGKAVRSSSTSSTADLVSAALASVRGGVSKGADANPAKHSKMRFAMGAGVNGAAGGQGNNQDAAEGGHSGQPASGVPSSGRLPKAVPALGKRKRQDAGEHEDAHRQVEAAIMSGLWSNGWAQQLRDTVAAFKKRHPSANPERGREGILATARARLPSDIKMLGLESLQKLMGLSELA